MVKCESCTKSIEETFLKKIIGTHVKDKSGKRHAFCRTCQKSLTKEELLEKV